MEETHPCDDGAQHHGKASADGVLLYYKYMPLSPGQDGQQQAVAAWYTELCQGLQQRGRIRVAEDGVNVTVGGSLHSLHEHIAAVRQHSVLAGSDIEFKLAPSPGARNAAARQETGFGSLAVKLVQELVTLGPRAVGVADPARHGAAHLSPQEFHAMLQQGMDPEGRPLLLLDARNAYETDIGQFRAPGVLTLLPDTRQFSDLPAWIDAHQEQLARRRVLMCCTGGVRCERASAYLRAKGTQYQDVYQLRGGIQRYLEAFPNSTGYFQGKNFVFDERLAVGPEQAPCAVGPEQAPCAPQHRPCEEHANEGDGTTARGDRPELGTLPQACGAEPGTAGEAAHTTRDCILATDEACSGQRAATATGGCSGGSHPDHAHTAVIGRCRSCGRQWDDYGARARCAACRMLVLLCTPCSRAPRALLCRLCGARQQEQAEAMAAAQRVLALRAPACEDAVPRRIRVLCLHGFRQTSKVLRARMAPLLRRLSPSAEFVFVDGPHCLPLYYRPLSSPDCQAVSTEPPQLPPPLPRRAWLVTAEQLAAQAEIAHRGAPRWEPAPPEGCGTDQWERQTLGWEETWEVLCRALAEQGPFDGVLGYSQGASVAAVLAALWQRQQHSRRQLGDHDSCAAAVKPGAGGDGQRQCQAGGLSSLRFVVLVSGFVPRGQQDLFREQAPLQLPSLHIMSVATQAAVLPQDGGTPQAQPIHPLWASEELVGLFTRDSSGRDAVDTLSAAAVNAAWPQVLRHDARHAIPSSKTHASAVLAFMQCACAVDWG